MMDLETDQEESSSHQTKSHFDQKDGFSDLLKNLLDPQTSDKDSKEILRKLFIILAAYQEQPHLLDPYLESFIQPAIQILRRSIQNSDPHPVTPYEHNIFIYFYYLTKTRGWKTVVKFFSHEVPDLEPTFAFLLAQDRHDHKIWEARYILLIWLSMIYFIPFDLRTVDSTLTESFGDRIPIVDKTIEICKEFLSFTGKERDASGVLLARILTRREVASPYINEFINWSIDEMKKDQDVFTTTGILTALCVIYKTGQRDMLFPTLQPLFKMISLPLNEAHATNALIRKIRIKLTQRVGLGFLKPRVAKWRYQRGNRLLGQNLRANGDVIDKSNIGGNFQGGEVAEEDNEDEDVPQEIEDVIEILLNGLRDRDTIVRWSSAKGLGRITQRLPYFLADDVIGSLFELFSENALHKDGVLDLSSVSDNTWHGACLAIAELVRRGLLLPSRLAEVVPWITHALKFDQKRASHSIGAHVRDAACYVCWSFARAYAPEVVRPYVQEIANQLVVVSVLDREVNIRRASSAAFQENVGRQGIFPNGIDIIQAADYFSIGNRTNSFLNVSVQIAEYPDYRYHMIDHIVNTTLSHWDKNIRELGSKALKKLTKLDADYMIKKVLPILVPLCISADINIAHGAMLGTGEVCLGLSEWSNEHEEEYWIKSSNEFVETISEVISKLRPKALTTFGSEQMRESACHLIKCLALSHWPVTASHLLAWKTVIHTSLERKEEDIQTHAVEAFGAVAAEYGISETEIVECISKVKPEKYKFIKRGNALALGQVSYRKHTNFLPLVIEGLAEAAVVQGKQNNDAEAKRNAIIALGKIVKDLEPDFKSAVTPTLFTIIIITFLAGLDDYTVDQRGDVGSWVREASMDALLCLVPLTGYADLYDNSEIYMNQNLLRDVIAGLLKQSVERIDRTRACAGKAMIGILYAEKEQNVWLLDVPRRNDLAEVFSKDAALNWSTPAEIYPLMVPLLQIEEYRLDLLTGLVVSAGSMTESLVRHSSNSLIEYISNLPIDPAPDTPLSLRQISETLISIFVQFGKQDRVIVPLIEVSALLFESGVLVKLDDDNMFMKFFEHARKESLGSKDIRKLMATIKLLTAIAYITGTKTRIRAIQQLLSYLVHSIPRIRTTAADQFYLVLSMQEEENVSEELIQAEEIVTSTNWTLPVEQLKPIRNQLYPLLNIPQPVFAKS